MKATLPPPATSQKKKDKEEGSRAKNIFILCQFFSFNSCQSPIKRKIQRTPRILNSCPKYLRKVKSRGSCSEPAPCIKYQSKEVIWKYLKVKTCSATTGIKKNIAKRIILNIFSLKLNSFESKITNPKNRAPNPPLSFIKKPRPERKPFKIINFSFLFLK